MTKLNRRRVIAGAIAALGLLLMTAPLFLRGSAAPPVPGREAAAPPQAPVSERSPEAPKAPQPEVEPEVAVTRTPEGSIVVGGSTGFRQIYSDFDIALVTPHGSLSLALEDVRIGERSVLPPGNARNPSVSSVGSDGQQEIVYAKGPIVEKYLPQGCAVEQLFVLGRELEPLRGEGPLRLTVSLKSLLATAHVRRAEQKEGMPAEEVIELRNADGAAILTYGGAVAIDAAGRTQPLRYALRDDALVMTLDAAFLASAMFPLTIDPLIGSNIQVAYYSNDHLRADVAFSPVANSYLIVVEDTGGGGNIYCRSISATGVPGVEKWVESGGAQSTLPRVARSQTNQFLVVWQEKQGGIWKIVGQFVTVSGNSPSLSGSKITIEGGVESFAPDVGFCSATSTYLVAYEQGSPDRNILARTVTTGGTVSGVFPISSTPSWEEKPTVSPVFTNPMGIAWVSRASQTAQGDILAASVDVQTRTASPSASVSAVPEDESDPDLGGSDAPACYVVWARQFGGADYDVWTRRVTFPSGGPVFGLANLAVGGNVHTFKPRCEFVDTPTTKRLCIAYAQNPMFPPTMNETNIFVSTFNAAADPPSLMETLPNISTGGAQPKNDDNPSIATKSAAFETLVVWDNEWSPTDRDIFAQRIDIALTPGFDVTPATGLVTGENGASATFTVRLKTPPTADVSFMLSSSNVAEGTVSPLSLTFTAVNWNTPQTVMVSGVNDFMDDGDILYMILTSPASSGDPGYNGLDPADASVTNTDDDTAGISVSAPSGPNTTEFGVSQIFLVVLTSQPTANVSIPLSSSDTTEGTVSVPSLTFTPADWNVRQVVRATGADDAAADGTLGYMIVTGPAGSTDPAYSGYDASDVSLTNLDNDATGITVTPTAGLVTNEGGGTATFTIVLNTIPLADVTLSLSSSNPGEGTLSPSLLTFTPENALTPRVVTVTGLNDSVTDGSIGYTIITSPASSADSQYNNMNPPDVGVTNTDNDFAGITVTPTSGLATNENGTTATFTVVLNTIPTTDVTIPLTVSIPSEIATSSADLTFTPADALVPQTVTLTGYDDMFPDGPAYVTIITDPATSLDPAYSGMDAADVSAINYDNEEPGITVTPTAELVTSEAGDVATFNVVLNTMPAGDVWIPLWVSNPAEGVLSTTMLVFTAADWNIPQPVMVTGLDDVVVDGNTPYFVATDFAWSTDPAYDWWDANDVFVSNTDNDVARIGVTPSSGLVTTEAGATATFSVVLTSAPTTDVRVTLLTSDPTEGTFSPASLTFTSVDWNLPQTVAVTGVDDTVVDRNLPFTIVTLPAETTDVNYSGKNARDAIVTNIDDDVADFVITPNSGLVTTEAGGMATFTVRLASTPSADVTLSLSTSDGTEGMVMPASLTFTPLNWSTVQGVTITGVDDAIADGNVPYFINTAPAVSADPNFNGVNPADVSVTNNDNDNAGVNVSAISGSTTESGGTATFTVVLTTMPSADVTIPISSSNPGEGTASAANLVFTPGNWNIPQTVTVTGVNDALTDGAQAYSIVTGDPTSADPAYDALTAASVADVPASNLDNEPEVSIATPDGSASETGPDVGAFTVTRTGSMAVALTVNFTVGGIATSGADYAPIGTSVIIPMGSPSATITILPINDFLAEPSETVVVTLAAGAYTITSPTNGTVTIADDDFVGVTVSAISGPTSENATSATFSVVLTSQPMADVFIPLFSSNLAEGTLSAASLTFTSGTWSTPQTVTVTGVNDASTDGNVSFSAVTGDPTSSDPAYDALTAAAVADVSVTN
ncbi:MAG: hypothetical protein HYY16_04900, partial [Planctomycetes bacterium]|nr:hypothetical protein [Planctomycetota bacterium]